MNFVDFVYLNTVHRFGFNFLHIFYTHAKIKSTRCPRNRRSSNFTSEVLSLSIFWRQITFSFEKRMDLTRKNCTWIIFSIGASGISIGVVCPEGQLFENWKSYFGRSVQEFDALPYTDSAGAYLRGVWFTKNFSIRSKFFLHIQRRWSGYVDE